MEEDHGCDGSHHHHHHHRQQVKAVYHEKQRLQFCLLHSLNNLLQEKDTFTREELDMIANELAIDESDKNTWIPFFKPHHNTLTGNYDVNVLIAALEARGKIVVWHDHRNSASSIGIGKLKEALLGFMMNVPIRKFGGLWRSRHWIAVRRIDGVWYDLDSDLHVPRSFADEEELIEFIDNIIAQGGEILVVLHYKQ